MLPPGTGHKHTLYCLEPFFSLLKSFVRTCADILTGARALTIKRAALGVCSWCNIGNCYDERGKGVSNFCKTRTLHVCATSVTGHEFCSSASNSCLLVFAGGAVPYHSSPARAAFVASLLPSLPTALFIFFTIWHPALCKKKLGGREKCTVNPRAGRSPYQPKRARGNP